MKYSTKRSCRRWLYAVTALMMTISVLFSGFNADMFAVMRSYAADLPAEQIGVLSVSELDIWINGEQSSDAEGMTVKDGDPIQIMMKWEIENNQTYMEDGEYVKCTVFEADIETLGIDMTKIPLEGGEPRTLYDADGVTPIGVFEVRTDTDDLGNKTTFFRISLEENVVKTRSNVKGGAYLDGRISLNPTHDDINGEERIVGIGDKTVSVIYEDDGEVGTVEVTKKAVGNIQYDGESKKYFQEYSITVKLTGELYSPVLTDDLAGLALYGEPKSDPAYKSYDPPAGEGEGFAMTFRDVPAGVTETYTVTYAVEIPRETIIDPETKDLSGEVNTAKIEASDPFGSSMEDTATAFPSFLCPEIVKTGSYEVFTGHNNSSSDGEYAYVEYNGKTYGFINYVISIRLGTASLELTDEAVDNALAGLKDTIGGKNMYALNYNSRNGNVSANNDAAQKAQRVLDGEITADDFTYDKRQEAYKLEYQLAFETDPVGNTLGLSGSGAIVNSAELTDPVKDRDFTFKTDATNTDDIGIDIMDKRADTSGEYDRSRFTVDIDFGKLKDIKDKDHDLKEISITDDLQSDSYRLVKTIDPSNSEFAQEQYEFLRDMTVRFSEGFDFSRSAEVGGEFALGSTNMLTFYLNGANRPNSDWFNTFYGSDDSEDRIMNMAGRAINGNNLPFTFGYDESSFVLDDFDAKFLDLLIDNGVVMTISYSAKLISESSRSFDNAAQIDLKFSPKNDPDHEVPVTERDTATGRESKTPSEMQLEKSYIDRDLVSVYSYGEGTYNDYFYHQPSNASVPNDSGNNTYTHVLYNEEGTITWMLEIPIETLRNCTTFYIDDTLPKGLELDEGSVKVLLRYSPDYKESMGRPKDADYYEIELYNSSPFRQRIVNAVSETSANGGTNVRFSLNGGMDKYELHGLLRAVVDMPSTFGLTFDNNGKTESQVDRVSILYKTKIDPELLKNETKNSISFTNTATPVFDGTAGTPKSAKAEIALPHRISKTGKLDERFADGCRRAGYTLNVNNNAAKLSSSGTLTVRDKLPENFVLIKDSVEIYKLNGRVKTRVAANVDYDTDTNEFSIELEDEQTYEIVYEVEINADPVPGWNAADKTTNTASLDGLSSYSGEAESNFAKISSTASVWVESEAKRIGLHKFYKDENGDRHDLAGAKFQVYVLYDNNGTVYMDGETPGIPEGAVCETDENGMLQLSLQLDKIYKLVEVETPTLDDGTAFADLQGGYYFWLKDGKSTLTDPRTLEAGDNEDLKALQEELNAALGDGDIPEHFGKDAAEDSEIIEYENFIAAKISGTKTWDIKDDKNADYIPDIGSDPVKLELRRRTDSAVDWADAEIVDAEPLWTETDEKNVWRYEYKDLPRNIKIGGTVEEYEYHVEEIVPDGFSVSYSETDPLDITNTLDTISISIEKTWTGDEEFESDYRLGEITFGVYADSAAEPVREVVLSGETAWKAEIKDLPRYRKGSSEEIVYSIKEKDVNGYSCRIESSRDSETGNYTFTAVNSFETVDISVTKKWIGDDRLTGSGTERPAVTAVLMADGVEVARKTIETADSSGVWSCSFVGMAKYAPNGEPIVYSVREENVPGRYTANVEPASGKADDKTDKLGFTIENTFVEDTVALTIRKIWADGSNEGGVRPDSISVQIYADGEAYEVVDLKAPENVSEDDPDIWILSVNGLPEYSSYKLIENDDGTVWIVGDERIVYTAEEVKQDGSGEYYVPSYDNADGVVEIVNTLDRGEASVSVTKSWEDDSNSLGLRPESITITLYADGISCKTVQIGAADDTTDDMNKWSYTFTGLEKYIYKDGKCVPIDYSVQENAVYKYDASVVKDGDYEFTVNNTLTTTSIKANKMDVENDAEVAGAVLALFDENGEQIAQWTSAKNELWDMGELMPGRKYTVRETSTPDGYEGLASEIVFTIDSETNELTVISGSDGKVDAASGVLIINNTLIEAENVSSETEDSSESSSSETDSSDTDSSGTDSSSSSSASSSAVVTNRTNDAPNTGSAPANAFAVLASISLAAAIVVGKGKREDR